MRGRRALGSLLLALACGDAAVSDGPKRIRIEHDDTEITEDTLVEPGHYRVKDANGNGVLIVKKDGVRLFLQGATLDGSEPGVTPDGFQGVGISVVGAKGVRILRGSVKGFRVGVRAERAPGVELRSIDASGNRKQRLESTPAREDPSDWLWPHENDEGQWELRYGAGLSLLECPGATVADCVVRRGQNGLLLSRSDGCFVHDCDFSFNSGWGIALWRSNENEVSHNRCDWCVRGYSHGIYARGQDSAGILVFEQCSRNRFVRNSATHSGDGFFLYAGHETTQRTGTGGCNDNVVAENDFSYAVANGIEATFSERNRFVGNDCYGSDYGVWAGYSRHTTIAWNQVRGCLTAGIAIEHGQRNLIAENRVEAVGDGVRLWWDDDKDLLASPFCKGRDCTSSANQVLHNWIRAGGTGIRLDGDTGSRVEDNRVSDASGTAGERYAVRGTPPNREPARGTRETRLSSTSPSGRDSILVDEWGPVDPREAVVFPRRFDTARREVMLHVLGDGRPWRVEGSPRGAIITPMEGTSPSRVLVQAVRGETALRSIRIPFRMEGETDFHVVEGSFLYADWDVRWFRWEKDPREDAAAYEALLAGPPVLRRTEEAIDFPWQSSGPTPELRDHFVTVATTTLPLEAGKYRLRVVSDDGIRVRVGDRLVLDDWTWHAPKEAVVDLDLPSGNHPIRVDHFEIDGWAVLRLSVEPVTQSR